MTHSESHQRLDSIIQNAQTGNRVMARVDLETLLPSVANQPAAWIWQAWLSDSPVAAIASLERALELDPDNEVALSGLIWSEFLKEWSVRGEAPSDQASEPTEPVTKGDESTTVENEPSVAPTLEIDPRFEPVEDAEEHGENAPEPTHELTAESTFIEFASSEPEQTQLETQATSETHASCSDGTVETETELATQPAEDLSIEAESVHDEEAFEPTANEDVEAEADEQECESVELVAIVAQEGDLEINRASEESLPEIETIETQANFEADDEVVEDEVNAAQVTQATEVDAEHGSPSGEVTAELEEQILEDVEALIETQEPIQSTESVETEREDAKQLHDEGTQQLTEQPQAERRDDTVAESEGEPTVAESTEPDQERPMVLAVDDSPTVRKLVAMTLERVGYEVVTAADGVAALNLLAERMPVLILSDINMPRITGYKLCKLVKKHHRTSHIPVVMLSGKNGVFDKVRGQMVGCADYITKPFESHDLIDKVRRYALVSSETGQA